MPRAVDGTRRKERRKKILKHAKGYWGRRGSNFRIAKDAVAKGLRYSYRDRKRRKRDFRSLWIVRIGASCRAAGITYSQFISGMKKAGIGLNRKALSNLAIEDPQAFGLIVERAKAAVAVQKAP
jgi:large subunit ribosomal protein L20